MEMELKYANLFKCLSDENRVMILNMLSNQELCACKILEKFNMSQPTLSHHMKILCDGGVVTSRRDGKWIHYTLNKEVLSEMSEYIQKLENGNLQIGLKKTAFERTSKTKLYVLTGFLGSGKTTILMRLLDQLKEERVGVIQNEFGKVSIDGSILKRDNLEITEINRGSIFCSCLKLSFVQALAEMSKQELSYLFVESSGLGDPSNVEEILGAVEVLAGDAYEFGGAICLVDAMNFENQIVDLETVSRQLKHCHLAIITKVDLVDVKQLEKITSEIRKINPICPIKLSSRGDLNLEFLQENLLEYQWAESEETTNSEETKPKTITLNFKEDIEQEKLELFLNAVKKDAYRIKGFFNLKDSGWNQVDVVGEKIDFKSCESKDISQLVFISKIGPAIIKELFSVWEANIDLKMELKN